MPYSVGPYVVVPLLDGAAGLDGSVDDAFAAPDPSMWDQWRRRHPEVFTPEGGWFLHVRCFLVLADEDTIVVDTGVGPASSPTQNWWGGESGRLLEELAAADVAAADVDTVVITHLHDDHIGGVLLDGGEPTFPNAEHLIQRPDWEWLERLANENEEEREIHERLTAPLAGDGLVRLLDGDHEIVPGVVARHAPGHTPGHQVLDIDVIEGHITISGDTFNHPAQVANPDWPSSTDDDPQLAIATRRSFVADALADGRLVAPTHLGQPVGRIVSQHDGGAAWEPVDETAPA
jgi:glyoxylase-like metal-dependent hydrolase (beta-lactamase superfamily II)